MYTDIVIKKSDTIKETMKPEIVLAWMSLG